MKKRDKIFILFMTGIMAVSSAPGIEAQESKFFLRLNYYAGFQTESANVSWEKEIYFEDASYQVDYSLDKAGAGDVGLGFLFSKFIGIEIGATASKRDLGGETAAFIPHPLLFNSLREGWDQGSYELTENAAYLNLVVRAVFGKFSLDLFGGPAYFMAKATLVNEIQYSESYPYDEITMSVYTESLDKNVIGFNGGARLIFVPAKGFGIFVGGQYLSGTAKFDPTGDVPEISLPLGGLRAGGGLMILF